MSPKDDCSLNVRGTFVAIYLLKVFATVHIGWQRAHWFQDGYLTASSRLQADLQVKLGQDENSQKVEGVVGGTVV